MMTIAPGEMVAACTGVRPGKSLLAIVYPQRYTEVRP
jgi:hypothetical protein